MSLVSSNVRALFQAAGVAIESHGILKRGSCAAEVAQSVISQFGGVEIGTCGAGAECASSNIRFFTQPQEHKHVVLTPWVGKIPSLYAIADAHNDHMIVFVDSEGCYYFFADPDGQLYLGGQTFGEAMDSLLIGKSYGTAIEPSA